MRRFAIKNRTDILVTGAPGFVGSHLLDYIATMPGYNLWGLTRPRSRNEFFRRDVQYIEGDITDYNAMARIVKTIRPAIIFHLAGQSFVPLSFTAPRATFEANITGTLNMLEAVRNESPETVIQVASSSEIYGAVQPGDVPIKETYPLNCQKASPYGISKRTCDYLAQLYHYAYGVKSVITRAFNHEGPRRGDVFVTSNFAKQVAEIEAGLKPPIIYHGNLEAIRDYTDVRDMVRAYWLAAHKCDYGTPYNICSGKGWRIADVLSYLLSKAKVEIKTQVDITRIRPADVPLLIGDSSKFRDVTGWQPEIRFEQTLDDTLTYWREKITVPAGVK